MPRSRKSIKSTTLWKALSEQIASNRDIANGAGVSLRALSEARNGFDVAQLKASSRKRHGVTESVTRLSIYLGLDAEDVLREIGIDPTESPIRQHIDRASKLPGPGPPDYVHESVAARGSDAPAGPIVGIVQWPPFFDGDIGGASMGLRLVHSLLGSLYPDSDGMRNLLSCAHFKGAEDQLLSPEPGTAEVVAGLYDLPWRRGAGVDVVPLPGLSVRLGALCNQPLKWSQILLADRPSAVPPHALVVDGDAGSKLLRGPVVYPRGRLVDPPITEPGAAHIAERIKQELEQQYADGFLFVADGPLVSRVHAKLAELGVDDLEEINDPDSAPSYKFGFGVRVDAPRFKELVEEALVQDLFARVLPKTVDLYVDLLSKDTGRRVNLDLSELDTFSPELGLRFLECAQGQATDWGKSEDVLKRATRNAPHFKRLPVLRGRGSKTNKSWSGGD